jgi:Lrp/AsnC family transcriptional regulator for asnA, asnC and gidA
MRFLDHIDRKLVTKLQQNGRTTLQDLGKTVGYSSMGVKKRVEKLQEENTMKISALINTEELELFPALMFLEMESSEAMQRLLERFEECPRVINIFTTLGGFNLVALVIAENRETLESISVEECSLRSGKGIRRSEFYPIGDIHYSSFLPVRMNLTHKNRLKTPCNVDCRPCQRFKSKKCVGCPTATYYRGPL